MTGRGVVPLIRVPPKVKINSDFYIEKVLKPILEEKVAALYPGELDKVFIHHDAASSHTSKKNTAYAEDLKARTGMTIIINKEIPVKSPDTSPLDFFGFGYLKQRLQRRRGRTIDWVWKIAQSEWNQISLKTVRKVYAAWKRRLRTVSRLQGQHIEPIKQIDSRRIRL